MNKQEFLDLLRKGLVGLPEDDIQERISFYGEMIDDRIEDGLTEAEAVADIGTVDEIVLQILEETPLTKIVKEKMKRQRKLKTWEIILLALGFPIWGSLLISAFAVVISLYVSVWVAVLSLWAVFVSFIGSAIGCIVGGIIVAAAANTASGLVMIAAALVTSGLAIFVSFACKYATKGTIVLTKKMILAVKNCFVKRG